MGSDKIDDDTIDRIFKGYQESSKEYETKRLLKKERAREELQKINEKWNKILDNIYKDAKKALSQDQVRQLHNDAISDFHFIEDHFIPSLTIEESNEIYKDLWSFLHNIRTTINFAVQNAEQNYRKEIFEQKLENRKEWRNLIEVILGKWGINIILIAIVIMLGYISLKYVDIHIFG